MTSRPTPIGSATSGHRPTALADSCDPAPVSCAPPSSGPATWSGATATDPTTLSRAVRARVDGRLDELLTAEAERWCRLDPSLTLGFDLLRGFIANGGKRLRPAFCLWGFIGSGGDPEDPRIVELCAAIEMLHTFALVHDDVMDGSDTRRHAPTVHRAVARRHAESAWRGEERRFSEGLAVLIGDLAFVYADLLLRGQPPVVTALFDEMRIELHVGQYLDLVAAADPVPDHDRASTVLRYKTAKYSVERPLHLGAALAGSLDRLGPGLSRYGLAVGEAFQLRDDLLGAFGDPERTGKPRGDDFREGKQTMLVHLARSWCDDVDDPAAVAALARLGAEDLTEGEADELCDVLERSDARSGVEQRIDRLMARAESELAALDLRDPAPRALQALGRDAAWRTA